MPYQALEKPPQGIKIGFGPSLDITGCKLASYGKANFDRPANTKPANTVRSFQLRIRCFDSGTNLVSFFPLTCLLIDIHLIPQPEFRGDL